jgi:hypothetical protein
MSDITVDGKSLGQLAFEAYRTAGEPTTFDGKPIPEWDELHGDRAKVHAKWEASAAEVARLVRASDLADRAFDDAHSGDFRERQRPTRWRPLAEGRIAVSEDEHGAYVTGGQPVDPAGAVQVERSRRIEVEAEPDEGPDAA